MIDPPKTLEEARKYQYGFSFNNRAYKEGRCAMGVWSGGRGSQESQCSRKNGFGPCGLYCAQHDPERVAKKWAEKSAKWNADAAKRAAILQRQNECVRALEGIPDPAKALEDARKALEEARLQIQYLHEKFKTTGSGVGVIARISVALRSLTPSQEQKEV